MKVERVLCLGKSDLNLRRTDPDVALLKMEGTLAKEQGLP